MQTNVNSGYTLTVADNTVGLQSASTGKPVLADVSSGKATSLTWPRAPKFGGTADTISIVNRAAIDYTVPSVVYTGTVTDTATPNYT